MSKLSKLWQYTKLFAAIFFAMAAGAACYHQYIARQQVEIEVVDKPHAEYLIRNEQPAAGVIFTESETDGQLQEDILTNDAREAEEENRPFKMLTTAYCEGEITATGTRVRRGICAVKKEWLGLTAEVYACNPDGEIGELLGYWECLDTGFGGDADGDGIGSIEDGRCIDMYFPNIEECREWMKRTDGQVYVRLLRLEG